MGMFSFKHAAIAMALGITFSFGGLASGAVPGIINYAGRLLDNAGQPVSTVATVQFTFWDAAEEGNQLGSGYIYQQAITPNDDGLYAVPIGDSITNGGPVPTVIFSADEVWLNINVNGEDLTPRARMTSAAYAFRADAATHADEAVHAATADEATLASQATTADIAEHADFADHALSANTADHAGTADHALASDRADFATSSTRANTSLGLSGTAYVTSMSTGTAVENGQALIAAYEQASQLQPNGQPLSATNRAVLLVAPGQYDLGESSLVLDTEYVDLIGISSARDNQLLFGMTGGDGTGVLMQSANDVRIENLVIRIDYTASIAGGYNWNDQDPAAYFPTAASTDKTVMRNCELVNLLDPDHNFIVSFATRSGVEYAGTYIDCKLGPIGFSSGYSAEILSGTFINITAGPSSFGGISSTLSGTFKNCHAGDSSFGNTGSVLSGTFIDCSALSRSFGIYGETLSGTFINCHAGPESFGRQASDVSGSFTNCTGDVASFGSASYSLTGTFTNCRSGARSFGGSIGTSGAKFRYCIAGPGSFGTGYTQAIYCIMNGAPLP